MSTFRDTLTKLFTRNVVIKRLPGKRLKAFDVNKTQMTGPNTSTYSRARWRRNSATGGYGYGYVNADIESLRKKMYVDYDLMDSDGLISSALDIFADECLGGDTKIPLLDGRILSLEELFQLKEENIWLYGVDDEMKFIPVQADRVVYNGKKKCVEITFDDGTKVKCTENHQWLSPENGIITTDSLKVGDGIFALATKISSDSKLMDAGYEMLQDRKNGKFDYVHRLVARNFPIENHELKAEMKQPVIHHTSFNKRNNSPEYLQWLGKTEHIRLHASLNDEMWKRRYADEEFMTNLRKAVSDAQLKIWNDSDRREWKAQHQKKFMMEYMQTLSKEEKKKKYGNPGSKNGRFGKGYLTVGPKNGRWIHGKLRYDEIDEYDALNILAEEYKSSHSNSVQNILKKYYDIDRSEYLELSKKICTIVGIDNIKSLPNVRLQNSKEHFITEIRRLFFDGYSKEEICDELNLTPHSLEKFLEQTGYKNGFKDLKETSNHKIVSIEYIGEIDVYDVVNAGDRHIYAIQANDGSKLFTHNCTTISETGELLVIKSDNVQIKKLLHNLFYDILNIEFNLWSWIRTTCKYGDYFLFMDVREGLGVVNVVPVHPGLIVREEGHPEEPDRVRFTYEGDSSVYSNKDKLEAFEVAHFRLLTDPNYLPYGRSVIEPARKVYKSLQLMEDSMLLYRITRAPERRLFKIDVGNIAPNEIDGYIEEIANSMKKTPYYDEATGEYNLRYNLMNSMEDFFLPTRGGESGTTIDTLPGLQNQGQIDDINYLKDKMHAALKIPRSFLGGEESGENAKAGLASTDIRFARTIERIQKVFVSELYKIAVVHLYTQGFRDESLLNFELYLTNPSLIYERQKIELLTSKMELVASIKEAKIFSHKYIYEVIFGMTEDEWMADRDQLIEDLKHEFRQQQIIDEGNDPKVSNKTFGTPHDIASMHMASKMDIDIGDEVKKLYKDDERAFNQGQPEKKTNFETDRDQDFGRDPTGKKDMEKKAGLESFIRSLKKADFKKILITEEEKPEIKMLDESSLIDGEI